MKILTVTDKKFWLRGMGSDERIFQLLDHASRSGHPLALFFIGRMQRIDRGVLARQFPTLETYSVMPGSPGFVDPRYTSRFSYARKRAKKIADRITRDARDIPWATHQDARVQRQLERTLRRWRPRVALFQFIRTAYLARDIPHDVRLATLLDTHDIMHLRATSFHQAKIPERHWTTLSREEEAEIFRWFGGLIAIQDEDKAILQSMCPDTPVLVARHAPSPPCAVSAPPPPPPFRILFYAGADPTNHDALRFILDDIWPRVISLTGADAQLHIAGSICRHLPRRPLPSHVHLQGPVSEPAQLYARIHAVLNPVRAGGGLKIKNVESLAYGKALITSPEGARGLGGTAGIEYQVCHSAHAYADDIIRLASCPELQQRRGSQGARLAEKLFGPHTAYAELDRFLDSISS